MLTLSRAIISLFLYVTVVPLLFAGCLVKDKPSVDALACTKKGECAPGFRCFDVPGQGALCLSNGAGLEPFTGNTGADASLPEEPSTDASESQPELASESEPVEPSSNHETQTETQGPEGDEHAAESGPEPEPVSLPEEALQESSSGE